MTGRANDIQRSNVDGVEAVWADRPGLVRAGIIFRVGVADEPLTQLGITHILEHLVMLGVGDKKYDLNASVSYSTTAFTVQGWPHEVQDFLDSVGASLNDLPYDLLDSHRPVIEDELEQHETDATIELAHARLGATGFGKMLYRHFGLQWVRQEEIEAWRKKYFTRQNATVWMTCAPQDGLRINLPQGSKQALPEPKPVHISLPGYIERFEAGVAVSWLMPDTLAGRIANSALETRAIARLRSELNMSYDVTLTSTPFSADAVQSVLTASCSPANVSDVLAAIERLVAGAVEDGFEQHEIDSYVDAFDRWMNSQDQVAERLEDEAEALLLDDEPLAIRLASARQAQLSDVNATLSQAMSTRLVCAADLVGDSEVAYSSVDNRSDSPIQGKRYKSNVMGRIAGGGKDLIVGRKGVSSQHGTTAITVLWNDWN